MTEASRTQADQTAGGKIDDEDDLENCVLYELVDDHICKITLNRPHKGNAMLIPDMNELFDAQVQRAQDDDAVKVIILTGQGKHFCAGEDTRRVPVETYGLSKDKRLPQSRRMRGIRRTYETLQRGLIWGDKVVIGACAGAVMGLGFEVAMACDMLVVSEDARFARRQSRMGFAAFGGQVPIMAMKLGMNRAMEVLLTGRTISTQELKEWGIANSVVPREQLDEEALRFARAIAQLPADGLMLGKRAMQQHLHGIGMGAYQNFATVAHPLFTNIVWREDEFNFLKERNRMGNKEAWAKLEGMYRDLGFD
ncbi:enoyl-CoA hydratase/isomerase family protein [Rhodobacterales bacterium HKCCE2091]|nr:enoyl-CoA hydratase/isomerase family protein [Rhodobacterales bacterium HKCCE2091]